MNFAAELFLNALSMIVGIMVVSVIIGKLITSFIGGEE